MLNAVFKNKIESIYFIRDDIIYYNESEADPIKMQQEKLEGEVRRDKTDKFYLGIALSLREGKINLDQAREILTKTFPGLDLSDLVDVAFVGESTHLKFSDMFVQIRRSGTDAKMRGYSCGTDKDRCGNYLKTLLHYEGNLVDVYKKLISQDFIDNIYPLADKIYKDYLYKGL